MTARVDNATLEHAIAELARELRSTGMRVEIASVPIGAGDRHACGRLAAKRALAALGEDPESLGYDGTRPIASDSDASVSITHDHEVAIAIAARVARLGIDRCPNDPRLPTIAGRFLRAELTGALPSGTLDATIGTLAVWFAATEAALKALGLGLLDGGLLDGTAVAVVSLEPPRLSREDLSLVVARDAGGALAVVYS